MQKNRARATEMPLVGRTDTKEIFRKVEQIASERSKVKASVNQGNKTPREPASPIRGQNNTSRPKTPSRSDVSASKVGRATNTSSTLRSSYVTESSGRSPVSGTTSSFSSSRITESRKAKVGEKSPLRGAEKENSSLSMSKLKRSVLDSDHTKQHSYMQDDDDCGFDAEDERLLKSLASKCDSQYDPTKLTNEFMHIINNNRKGTQDFMPQGRCQQKRDGRNFMKVGEVDIYYDESVLEDIINFGMRSKVSTNQH